MPVWNYDWHTTFLESGNSLPFLWLPGQNPGISWVYYCDFPHALDVVEFSVVAQQWTQSWMGHTDGFQNSYASCLSNSLHCIIWKAGITCWVISVWGLERDNVQVRAGTHRICLLLNTTTQNCFTLVSNINQSRLQTIIANIIGPVSLLSTMERHNQRPHRQMHGRGGGQEGGDKMESVPVWWNLSFCHWPCPCTWQGNGETSVDSLSPPLSRGLDKRIGTVRVYS